MPHDAAVIPAYNEGSRITKILPETQEHVDTVIVVDDGSTDRTAEHAAEEDVTVIRNVVNMGKGFALRRGVKHAINEKDADRIVTLDADGQHDPGRIPDLFNALTDHDIVFTYRDLRFNNAPWVLRFGNAWLRYSFQFMFDIAVQDPQCGYRAFTANVYPQIEWGANGYFADTEILINTAAHSLSYTEIPIEAVYDEPYKGTTVPDGVKIWVNMVWRWMCKWWP